MWYNMGTCCNSKLSTVVQCGLCVHGRVDHNIFLNEKLKRLLTQYIPSMCGSQVTAQ